MHLKHPIDAIRKDLAFCPENRKTEGIIGDLSIRDNIALALQAKKVSLRRSAKRKPRRLQTSISKSLR